MAEPDPDDGRPVVQPYADPSQDIDDDEAQAVAEAEPASPDEDDLVAAAESGDRTASLTGEAVPAPAEEAALHIEEGERKHDVSGKRGSVRVERGGVGII